MSLYVRRYDLKSKQVKCYYKNADESMWADAFSKKKIDKRLWSKNSSMDYFIKKFEIKKNAKTLEAGCGIAQNVYYLHTKGLDSYGVDFSEEIVKRVNEELPELKVSVETRTLDLSTYSGFKHAIEYFLSNSCFRKALSSDRETDPISHIIISGLY